MKFGSWLSTCTSTAQDAVIPPPPPKSLHLFSDDIQSINSSSIASSSSSLTSRDSNSSLQSNLSILTLPSVPSLQKLSPESLILSVKTLLVTTLKPQKTQAINFLKIHENLLYAVSGRQVSVFDVDKLNLLDTFNASDSSSGSVKSLAFCRHKIFTAHQDCKIRAWKLSHINKQHRLVATLPTVGDRLWNSLLPKNYVSVRRYRNKLWVEHYDAVSSLAAAERFLHSVSWDKYLKIWCGSNFRCMESIKAHDDAINAVVVSEDGLIYTGSADKKIKVWGRPFGDKRNALIATLEKHKSAVNALALSSDGSVLFSGACDRSILVWEREDSANHMVVTGALRGHAKAILCLMNVSDMLFSGSADRTVRVWSRGHDAQFCCLTVLDGHDKPVRSLVAIPEEVGLKESGGDGRTVVKVFSGSFDGEIKVWKVMVSSNLKNSHPNSGIED